MMLNFNLIKNNMSRNVKKEPKKLYKRTLDTSAIFL
jgi:hypothetical protein